VLHTRTRRAAAVLLVVAVVAACSAMRVPEPGRAEPWPQRPVVDLTFDVAPDLATVSGRETVVFIPDLPICELVFRLWSNKPTTAEDGTAMRLTAASVRGVPIEPRIVPAGAPEGVPGTLAELPLPECVDAGTELTAELAFTVKLGEDSGERVGHDPRAEVAWFATAFPLLAWVRGAAWAREHAVDMPGETVTSEAFRLADLEVVAPEQYRVLGTGVPAGTAPGPRPGTTTHRFTAEAVRDVNVAVGRFDVVEREAGDITLTVGTPSIGSEVSAAGWADALAEQLANLEDFLGLYPYEHLWASIVPPLTDGVEFPTSLQFGDVDADQIPALAAHELAHQWFYSLVGNNQARNPWIDEAFATYAQARAAGQEEIYTLDNVPDPLLGRLGAPMEYWADTGGFGRYVRGVYDQGAAVLLEARRRAGPDRFDAALRDYLAANAHRVAHPADVEAAFRELPEAVALLREYAALP
jgi:hypothetical protein